MKFSFIASKEVAFPVSSMCRVLGVTKSGFYAWVKRPKPARAKSDAQLTVTVAAVHQRSRRTYGSPRVHRELKGRGVRVSKKRIERLMRENGIHRAAKRRFKRATASKHGGPIAPNILARHFRVDEPNRVWVTDVTGKGGTRRLNTSCASAAQPWGDGRATLMHPARRSFDSKLVTIRQSSCVVLHDRGSNRAQQKARFAASHDGSNT
jgi:hypothetical protein